MRNACRLITGPEEFTKIKYATDSDCLNGAVLGKYWDRAPNTEMIRKTPSINRNAACWSRQRKLTGWRNGVIVFPGLMAQCFARRGWMSIGRNRINRSDWIKR